MRGSYHDEQVGVRPRENRNVHRDTESVRLVETHAKVSLSAQQQEDEDANVHKAHASCMRTQTPGCEKLKHTLTTTDSVRLHPTHTDQPWLRSG